MTYSQSTKNVDTIEEQNELKDSSEPFTSHRVKNLDTVLSCFVQDSDLMTQELKMRVHLSMFQPISSEQLFMNLLKQVGRERYEYVIEKLKRFLRLR